jgi:cysteine-rich repeat protein
MRIALPVAALFFASLMTASAVTQTVVVDENTDGTVFDGIIDGFPNLAPRDGTGDFQGNPLSVARQGDVTEIRSLMEFPLAAFAGQPIVKATLTFNVDDVVSTLGPDTAFNGKAASTILVHPYAGDGLAELIDYKRTAETPFSVSTGPGQITDQTLKQTGAVFFDVDVTARVAAAIDAGTPFLGFLWRTTDSPTATSLDDGRNGAMPGEGAETSAGSKLPILTVEYGTVGPACIDGTTCDDANPCTTNDFCTDGVCAGEAIEGPCDDGDSCTTSDACVAGVCTGRTGCGDGVLDVACGETCDDGNTDAADGCSATCLSDTLQGRGKKPCLLEIAFGHPVRNSAGGVASPQECTDDDPACDDDPTPGTCGFTVAACVGRCDGVTGVAPAVVSPNRSAKQRANRDRLEAALVGLTAPACSSPVRIDVPVRQKGKKVRPGKAKLNLRAKAPGVGRDKDQVLLVCHPAS